MQFVLACPRAEDITQTTTRIWLRGILNFLSVRSEQVVLEHLDTSMQTKPWHCLSIGQDAATIANVLLLMLSLMQDSQLKIEPRTERRISGLPLSSPPYALGRV